MKFIFQKKAFLLEAEFTRDLTIFILKKSYVLENENIFDFNTTELFSTKIFKCHF